MKLAEQLEFSWSRRLPLVLQTEAAECGLACLAMVAGWHGLRSDLHSLRGRFGISQRGITLAELVERAEALNFSCRPLRLEMEDLAKLECPCILHWDLDHFVVLKRVRAGRVEIHDPARGVRSMPLSEVGKHFTGVALELTPLQSFRPRDERNRVRLRDLVGRTTGLKPAIARIFVFALMMQVLALVLPFITQLVVDEVLVARDDNLLALVALVMVLIAATQATIGLVRDWAVMTLAATFNVQWTLNIFRHLVRLPIDWFEKRHIGDINAKVDAVKQIQRGLTTDVLELFLHSLIAVGSLAMMLLYSAKLTFAVLAVSLVYWTARWLWFSNLRQAAEEAWITGTRESSHFLETVRGILSLRVNGAVNRREVAWRNLVVDARNAQMGQKKWETAYQSMNALMTTLSMALVIWFGAGAVLAGQFSVGMLVAYLAWQASFTTNSVDVINKIFQFRMLVVYTERLADIVLTPTEDSARSGRSATAHAVNDYGGEMGLPEAEILRTVEQSGRAPLEIKGLRFAYAEDAPALLQDVNLTLQAGEVLALVGGSGSGKTTLLKLILGIYRPQRGSIRIFDIDSSESRYAVLRKKIGTVLQDDALFSGTILDNITLFAHDPDPERAAQCAQLAEIHRDVASMPMGYHTRVGEMGSSLSGGQRQRLLLARALYKQPYLLILDEATSHLDVLNEARVAATLRQLGLPILLIAHRPETVASADRVLELNGGQIVPLQTPKQRLGRVAVE
jgi:ATP-binding cassette, subfamily B, bacterial CvaB/MchF/RaxB